MTQNEKRTAIAFGVSIVIIGYIFIPIQAPEWLNWLAAIMLLILGSGIIVVAIRNKEVITKNNDETNTIEKDSKIEKETDHDTLLKILGESNTNARSLIDLRFKHFTSFLAIHTLIIGVFMLCLTVNNANISQIFSDITFIKPIIIGFGIAFTILFWMLDFSTHRYYENERARIVKIEEILNVPKLKQAKPYLKIKASWITNIIFIVVLTAWVSLIIIKT